MIASRVLLTLATAMAAMATACVDLSRPPLDRDGPFGLDAPDARETGGERLEAGPIDAPADQALPDPDADPPETGEDGPAVDLPGDLPPEGPPDLAPVPNGNPCTTGPQCASGFCASGVCCNEACTGLCQACNVAGKLGTCSPVPAGEDPDSDCPRDPPSSCAFDGTCDGAGTCRRYPANTECLPGSCTGATETAASLCNGMGSCIAGATRSCNPNVCMGASCGGSCTSDGQCQTGFYCAANRCTLKLTQGMPCGGANQCATGFCVDGVCCASQCGQLCFACNVTGQQGTCVAAPAGQDPRSQCPMEPASTCGRQGGCNGAGACRLHPPTTVCQPGSCTAGTETAPATCNGIGVCAPPTTRACAPYACGPSACASSCTTAAQCADGVACTNTACSVLPGLALHWRFEELAGTVASDSSGNNLHGVYTGDSGAPTRSMSVPPPIRYNNTSSRDFLLTSRHAVRLANFPASLKPVTNFTLSVWYRSAGPLDADGSELISGGNAYALRLGPTQIEVSKATAAGFTDCRATVAGYLNGAWHHVAAVYTPTSMTIYFDGTARGSCANSANITYTGAGPDLWVGRHGNGEAIYDLTGGVDEVRIYNRALSAAEIAALAGGGS